MPSNRDIASLLDIAKAAKQVLKFKGNSDRDIPDLLAYLEPLLPQEDK